MDGHDTDAEAIGWMMKLRGGGSAGDWEAFTAWLEADPRNAAAYEEAELADEGLESLRPPKPIPQPDPIPQPARVLPTRRFVIGGGIAAALAAVVAFSTLQTSDPTIYAIETRPGERRAVDLADGSRIELNGGTRILLDRADARSATLERGEALFTVVHDDSDPFEVVSGEARIVDLGTVFNVVRADARLEIGVAEGAVSYRQSGRSVELQPGMTLTVSNGETAQIARGPTSDVASWRSGRLTYRGAQLRQVASDLSRNLGLSVEAAPAVANRPFTGVINLDAGAETIQRAASLMGVGAARRGDGGWLLTPGTSETS